MDDSITNDVSSANLLLAHWPSVLLVTYSLTTITINLLLLLVFTKRRSVRTVSNRFVINLLFISLCSSLLLTPFVALDAEPTTVVAIHPLQMALSIGGAFIPNFVCTASILSVLLIGVDQYLAVLHPLRSHAYMSTPKSSLLICGTHAASAGSAALATLSSHLRTTEAAICFRRVYAVLYLAAIIAAPFASICIIYVLIYRAAHRNSARLRRSHVVHAAPPTLTNQMQAPPTLTNQKPATPRTLPKVRSAPSFTTNRVPHGSVARTHSDRAPSIMTSLRAKLSNASASLRYREESRTAKISLMVIVMVLVCYAPYGLALMVGAIAAPSLDGRTQRVVVLLLIIAANLLSPVLFALRNRRVRRELRRLVCDVGVGYSPPGGAAGQRRPARPLIVIQHIETTAAAAGGGGGECGMQVEPFLPQMAPHDAATLDTKSILKRVCSQNWAGYKKCSFIDVPEGCLDARGSFSSASTQISTEE